MSTDLTTDPMRPFSQGFKAGILGHDPRTCPYDKMTAEWAEWQRGQEIGAKLGEAEVRYVG